MPKELQADFDRQLNGSKIWTSYVSSLVIDFNQSMPDAWSLTLIDYWVLHCYKYPPTRNSGIAREEIGDMTIMLQKKGIKL